MLGTVCGIALGLRTETSCAMEGWQGPEPKAWWNRGEKREWKYWVLVLSGRRLDTVENVIAVRHGFCAHKGFFDWLQKNKASQRRRHGEEALWDLGGFCHCHMTDLSVSSQILSKFGRVDLSLA